MKGFAPDFQLVVPHALSDVLQKLAAEPNRWRLFAGGTDIMVLYEAGELKHTEFLSVLHLPELNGITETAEHITIGAATTYATLQKHPLIRKEFGNLVASSAQTGSLAIQNRGTLGGNIVNASPAGDSLPALMAYDADVELVSTTGKRWVPYHSFHLGYKKTVMAPGEILTRVRLPRTMRHWNHFYRKVGTRKAQAISKVVFAGTALMDNGAVRDIRIAVGSVGPVTMRCRKVEQALKGFKLDTTIIVRARELLLSEITPIDDIRSTEHFRRDVAVNVLVQWLGEILETRR